MQFDCLILPSWHQGLKCRNAIFLADINQSVDCDIITCWVHAQHKRRWKVLSNIFKYDNRLIWPIWRGEWSFSVYKVLLFSQQWPNKLEFFHEHVSLLLSLTLQAFLLVVYKDDAFENQPWSEALQYLCIIMMKSYHILDKLRNKCQISANRFSNLYLYSQPRRSKNGVFQSEIKSKPLSSEIAASWKVLWFWKNSSVCLQ